MRNPKRIIFLFAFFVFLIPGAFSQFTEIVGTVTDQNGDPLLGASVVLPNLNLGTVTKNDGSYNLRITVQGENVIRCSFLGYDEVIDTIHIKKGQTSTLNFTLNSSARDIEGVVIQGVDQRENTLTRLNMKSIDQVPNSSGNIETILKTMSGIASGNEFSSQYSVRGGSYDENLIYVNDIEIYKPLLVQNATQEGLSFVNPDMISSLQFSAGGFEAEYGDKMASVLDVKYAKPTEFKGSVSASLLGGSVHLAGANKENNLYASAGLRYKTTQYLLNSLDVTGDYLPRFIDFQTLIGYKLTDKSSISFLGNYSSNSFTLRPDIRSTNFGSIAQTFNFTVYYEGMEKDLFNSLMGALSYSYTPNSNTNLKVTATAFNTDEQVNYDILSEYWMNAISRGSGGGDSVINIGTGASLEHARNKLNANIYALEHKGFYSDYDISWKWGAKIQYETIEDQLSEWQMLDSAGMSSPYNGEFIELDYSYKAYNTVSSFKYQAFLQNSRNFETASGDFGYTIGARLNYWDYNKELLFSPRASITYTPPWDREVDFYLATGLYQQPAFYKELKDYKGDFYPDVKAQKSFHLVLGTDYHFYAWSRPFILSSEVYYKNLYRLIPYQIENIQLKYMPWYKAHGYATGLDFRVNGEFVPGIESWFSMSFLQTREDTYNDSYQANDGTVVNPGYYRRPSDQTFTFSVFFQDYLPMNPHYKVHLLINYGTGLPYSGPKPDRPSQTYLLSQYRRVDIGFSRNIKRHKNKAVGLNDIWITLEVLNLLDAQNTSSYDWVRTVENNEGFQDDYAIPNYLSGRRFNIKISARL